MAAWTQKRNKCSVVLFGIFKFRIYVLILHNSCAAYDTPKS